ncbi:MAG: ATP-binding protein, partial [Myxococcota bacterium]
RKADAVGEPVQRLRPPWPTVLSSAREGPPVEMRISVPKGERVVEVGRSRVGAGGYVVVVVDLTETKLIQAKMAHQDRLQSIGRLAAGIAHEIGNPLSGILIVAKNLQAEVEPEDLAERLQLVEAEASRIKSIVESLAAFSRRESLPATEGIRRQTVDLQSIISDAVRLMSMTHQRVKFVATTQGDLRLCADAQKLTQVLVNLLSNASDASASGAEVNLRAYRSDHRVIVEVRDEGGGMDEEVRHKIFEPFFTTKEPGAGTGLGLAIVHRIVSDHRGSIDVDSSPRRGTTFRVQLPVEEEAQV